jgi:hypothetical protein
VLDEVDDVVGFVVVVLVDELVEVEEDVDVDVLLELLDEVEVDVVDELDVEVLELVDVVVGTPSVPVMESAYVPWKVALSGGSQFASQKESMYRKYCPGETPVTENVSGSPFCPLSEPLTHISPVPQPE